ncbi:LuxR C-terminal-related transcriptional regulator [Micromonospora rubida]|uniref:LuxR C-terminal-related transcriptional regulator n=1 Tax=Micromonospora rubida TaxID=2697657 RepID=A0ABW7SRE1_9ACTN
MEVDVFSVAIVDEQPVSRAGMEKLVSDDPALEVVASVGAIDDLPHTGRDAYCVVIVDLPAHGGGRALEIISRVAGIGRPLVCASWEQPPTLLATIRAGARGCITRHTEQTAVRDALRIVAKGGFYLCPRLVGRFQTELTRQADDDPSGLAPREVETLRWIALGFTHAQVATRMGLSQATVNTYAKRIRAKLNVSNKAELTRMAIELGHLTESRQTYPAA